MNALLVQPCYADAFWTYKYVTRWMGKKAASPPLGLLIVAALLPPDWHKTFVGLSVRPLLECELEAADIVLLVRAGRSVGVDGWLVRRFFYSRALMVVTIYHLCV